MLNRLKSYSCPHLALSSCQTIQGGPGMRTPDMAAWRALTDLKSRQLQLKSPPQLSLSQTETETAPCILVTPPCITEANQEVVWASRGNNNNLSPLQYRDVHL